MKALWHSPKEFLRTLRAGGSGGVLARGAGSAFSIKVAGTLLVLANQIILTRVLGVAAYGQYVYVVTWLGLLTVLSVAGLNSASVRFVSDYSSRADWGLLRGFLRRSSQIGSGLSVLIAVLMAAAVFAFRSRMDPALAFAFGLGCILLPIVTAMDLRSAALRGFKKIVMAQLPPDLLRPALMGAGIVVLWRLSDVRPTASQALMVNVAVTAVCLGLMVAVLRAILRGAEPSNARTYRTREWISVAFPLLLITGFNLVLARTDTLMLGILQDTTQAGIYAVASRLADLVPFMLLAVNSIAAPMIAELHARGRTDELQRVLTLAARIIAVFSVPAAVILVAAGTFLLRLFGEAFTVGYVLVVILSISQLVSALCGSVGSLMAMTGHQTRAAAIVGACAALNVAMNAWLIPVLGATGAAIATASTRVLWNAAMLGWALRVLRVNPTPFVRAR